MHAIILTDNTFLRQDMGLGRGTGAHRIATHLRRHGLNIEVVDFILRWNLEEFKILCNKLVSEHTLFLGIGSNLFEDEQFESFNEKLYWFKSNYPNVPIILGGNNLLARSIEPIDYRVEGYGENSMLELIAVLQKKKEPNSIKWSKRFPVGHIIDSTIDYPLTAKDTHDLAISYLDSDFIDKHEALGLETARGCVFKCKFCTYPLIGKKKLDYMRDPTNIYNELLENYNQWGSTRYIICEDTFNDREEKLELLADLFDRLPFKPQLASYLRFDLIMSRPNSKQLLKKLGLRGAFFGIETFNRNAGQLIGKGSSPEKLKSSLLDWRDNMPEVQLHCGHIVGLPEDDEKTQWETLNWYEKNKMKRWGWSALYITDTNKTIHTSEFSRNYEKYGLTKMTDEEIKLWSNLELKHIDKKKHNWHLGKLHKNKMIFWKNSKTGMNYFKAEYLENQLNQSSKTRLIGPWQMFSYGGLGYSLDEMQKWGYHSVTPHVPENELLEKTLFFIKNYIQKKNSYTYELPKTPAPMFFN